MWPNIYPHFPGWDPAECSCKPFRPCPPPPERSCKPCRSCPPPAEYACRPCLPCDGRWPYSCPEGLELKVMGVDDCGNLILCLKRPRTCMCNDREVKCRRYY